MVYLRLLIHRALASAVLLIAVASVAMLLARAAPGQVGEASFGQQTTAAAQAADLAQAGLDRTPAAALYGWWRHAVSLDLGRSLRFQRPVLPLVLERAGNSAVLAVAALALALLVGLPAGVVSARGAGWRCAAIRLLSIVCLSVPPLVLSIFLAWTAVRLGFALGASTGDGSWLWERARVLIVPVLALGIPLAATFERLQSHALARVATEPSLRNARGRGVPEARVWWRHAWRMSAPPVAAVGGTIAGAVLSGALAVEVVTAWPGLGRLTFDALVARDAPLVAGCAAITAIVVSAGALAADIIGLWADPRARDSR